MASHFDAVGFATADTEERQIELVQTALARVNATGDVVDHDAGRTATYRDPSGATFAVHTNRRGGLECGQPGFEGQFRGRWRPLGVVSDPEGCPFCDLVYAELLDEDGEMVYPLALQLETMGADRALIPYGEPGEVRFVGLWEEGELWPDEAAFERAQEAEWGDVAPPDVPELELPAFRGFASRSLIPSGTFGLDGGAMTSHVIAHGIVSSVDERRNELGGGVFRLVRLDTLGRIFDTCLAPDTVEREELLAPGAVARATLWLVGRPLTLREEPGDVPSIEQDGQKRGLLGRLFGRRRR